MTEFKEKLLTHFRTSCRGLNRLRQILNESPVKSPVILRGSQPPAEAATESRAMAAKVAWAPCWTAPLRGQRTRPTMLRC